MKSLKLIFYFVILHITLSAQTTLEWAKHFGSTNYDAIAAMKLDSDNNMYLTGTFTGTVNFDMGTGTHTLTSKGLIDVYIAKYDSSGNFIWVDQIGGKSNEISSMLQLDDSNNVYISGIFTDTVDFDPSPLTYNLQSVSDNSFIAKYNHDGNLIWANQFSTALGLNLSLDSYQNITLTGSFHDTVDIDPGISINNLISTGDYDSFILRLNSNGEFVWVKQIGGNGSSVAWALSSTSSSGNIYVSGYMNDTIDFDPGLNVHNLYPQNGHAFILKLDSSGNFIWAKNYGRNIGLGTAYGSNLTLDSKNNIYLQGYFSGTIDIDPTLMDVLLVSNGQFDVFLAKLDIDGNLIWAKSVGSSKDDFSGYTAIDSIGNVYLTGNFRDTIDIDPGIGVYNLICKATFAGISIAFVSKLDSSGNFQWASQIGDKYNTGAGIELDSHENLLVYGNFYSTCDFDLSGGVHNITSYGNSDGFISKSRQLPVGIKEENEIKDCKLYPNPTSGASVIEFNSLNQGEYKIDIWGVDGKKIKSLVGKFYNGINKIDINIFNMSSGIYFLNLNLNGILQRTLKIDKY